MTFTKYLSIEKKKKINQRFDQNLVFHYKDNILSICILMQYLSKMNRPKSQCPEFKE